MSVDPTPVVSESDGQTRYRVTVCLDLLEPVSPGHIAQRLAQTAGCLRPGEQVTAVGAHGTWEVGDESALDQIEESMGGPLFGRRGEPTARERREAALSLATMELDALIQRPEAQLSRHDLLLLARRARGYIQAARPEDQQTADPLGELERPARAHPCLCGDPDHPGISDNDPPDWENPGLCRNCGGYCEQK